MALCLKWVHNNCRSTCPQARDEQWLSWESRSQGSPPFFLVLIPVSISRLWSQKSWFQSRYQDSRFQSLASSLDIKTQISKISIPADIKTQLSKVSIPVLISRLNSWISNLCSNLETVSAKQKILENVTPTMCKMLLVGKMILTFELML